MGTITYEFEFHSGHIKKLDILVIIWFAEHSLGCIVLGNSFNTVKFVDKYPL